MNNVIVECIVFPAYEVNYHQLAFHLLRRLY